MSNWDFVRSQTTQVIAITKEAGRAAIAAALFAVVGAFSSAHAQSPSALPVIQKTPAETAAIRENHVGIVTGGPTGIYARLGNDFLRLFDDRATNKLRLSVLIGAGSIANLDDLRNLPGVSLAILQGDVLEAYAVDRAQFGWLENNVRYVGRLHNEILHVITRKDVIEKGGTDTICALRGRRVNVGGLRSGTIITARKVLNDMLGLGVTFDEGSIDEGFGQLADKKVDALLYVVGRPAPVFANDRLAQRFSTDNFEWLSVPASLLDTGCPGHPSNGKRDATVYEEVSLTSDDYPQLIAQGPGVASLAVPAVLAAYRFEDPQSARSKATALFIQQFLQRGADPAGFARPGGGFDKNWCGLDLAAPVRTWRRHDAAAAWIDANRAAAHPLPTRVECAAHPVDRSFCTSNEGKVTEFARRIKASGRALQPTDSTYMVEFAAFIQRECP